MKILLELFIVFFKIGSLTFGGGIAMLPMLQREIVNNKNWATEEELIDYYSIGQCTPGIIAINTATFIGYKIKGKIGAVFSTFGMVCPSLIIIIIIASFIKNFLHIQWVMYVFAGIKIAVAGLVLEAFISFFKKNVKSKISFLLCILAFVFNLVLNISPIYIIFVCIVFSLFFTKYKGIKEDKK
ncbi:chromate transporter [uncultured Tyzzerella sp.]|uniref:chromate transporter n=1 Tax=uncultured Tyzzerella sp. TaxID=2321398 RepID=UPI0029424806|nr:chromate transporter [uncultured Tyzzerella sp.]